MALRLSAGMAWDLCWGRVTGARLPGDPDCDGVEEHGIGAPGATDCRRSQDAVSVPGDFAGCWRLDFPHRIQRRWSAAPPTAPSFTNITVVSTQAEEGKGLVPAKINPVTGKAMLDTNGNPILDYDMATPNMLLHFFPTGILGLG